MPFGQSKYKTDSIRMLASILRLIPMKVAALLAFSVVTSAIAGADSSSSSLDRGFHLLYNLDFSRAQEQFSSYQEQHPDDPMGAVSEASGLLFSEMSRLGMLSTHFFDRDSGLGSKPVLRPDPMIRQRFDSALQRAEAIARSRLRGDPKDRTALLAITLVNGLRADYTALFEHRYRAALRYTRDATNYARELLAICPDCFDAYIATGISRYLIGSVSAPLRWILRMGGFSGDKKQGMADLELVSERGHYLAPYARILLAIAEIRDKNPARARQLLTQLRDEFPGNPLFDRELARLNTGAN
jgi:hypothetical protein